MVNVAQDKTAKWAEKIKSCPVGRCWGLDYDRYARVQYSRKPNGEHVVYVCWAINEGYSDDPGSFLTPVKGWQNRSHAGIAAHYLTVDAAIVGFIAATERVAIRSPEKTVFSGADRVEKFSTHTASSPQSH